MPSIVMTLTIVRAGPHLDCAGAELIEQAALPAGLDSYITKHVRLTPAQRSQLLAGQPMTQLLDADTS
jgi:hypothetical protein